MLPWVDLRREYVLLVSGDVSDELGALEQALACLAAKFAAVFYCVGNHELWIRKKDRLDALPCCSEMFVG